MGFEHYEIIVEDHDRSGHPSSIRNDEIVAKIRQKIKELSFKIDEVSEETGMVSKTNSCSTENSWYRMFITLAAASFSFQDGGGASPTWHPNTP